MTATAEDTAGLTSSDGAFVRPPSTFRGWVSADGSTGFRAESGRYHLYVSLACPWAHRFSYLSEAHAASDPAFEGRVSVPVLWDRETGRIVSNESADIVVMLNSEWDEWGDAAVNLYPEELRPGNPCPEPFDRTPMTVQRDGSVEEVVAFGASEIEGAVGLVGIDDKVADLHLEGEPQQYTRPDRDRTWLGIRAARGEHVLQRISVRTDGLEVAEVVPTDTDELVAD